MTPLAKRQLLQALHPHYRAASKTQKTQILEAFVKATGYNRKYAIGLLHQGPQPSPPPRGRPARYGPGVVDTLRWVWEASGHLCGKRLRPFLPPFIEALERAGELILAPHLRAELLAMSAATIDRKLAAYRRRPRPHGVTTTRPGSLLKPHIPIRTFAQWDDHRPGFTEMDLVAHCGESTVGEFVHSLALVDIATLWWEPQALPNRSQKGVFAALQTIRVRLPFELLGIDGDNDNAFINAHLLRYAQAERLTFTRSREYRKNDQAHIEERNGSVIRRLIGYDRYEGLAATEALNRVYAMQRLWINFFQPSMKLIAKERHGAKVRKHYDEATTPFQRVLESPAVSATHKQALEELYRTLNPVQIRQELERRLQALWGLATRSASQMRQPPRESQVFK